MGFNSELGFCIESNISSGQLAFHNPLRIVVIEGHDSHRFIYFTFDFFDLVDLIQYFSILIGCILVLHLIRFEIEGSLCKGGFIRPYTLECAHIDQKGQDYSE